MARAVVHDALRQATHLLHARLNDHPLLAGLLHSGSSLNYYLFLLTAYYEFYAALEASIEDCIVREDIAFSYHDRRKLPWIIEDLQYFEVDPKYPPYCPSCPLKPFTIDSKAQLIGVLYTIEGSTLGGRIISRHLYQHFSLSADNGARFFSGYGDKTADYWHAFLNFADSLERTPALFSAAEKAAMQIFQGVENVLDDAYARLVAA